MRRTSLVAMGLIAAALGTSGCSTADADADTLRDEFMAWSNRRHSPGFSSCMFTGIEETHGRDVIREWLDLAPKVERYEIVGSEGMEMGLKIMPTVMACARAEANLGG